MKRVALCIGSVLLLVPLSRAQPPLPPPKSYAPAVLPTVSLIDAGQEPRRALRLKPVMGQTQAARLRTLMRVSMKSGDADYPSPPMPAVLMTLSMRADSQSEGGDIAWSMSVDDCSVEPSKETPPEIANMVKASLGQLSELDGAGIVTDRGLGKTSSFVLPDAQDPESAAAKELGQQVGELGVPLPVEAVGKGARWSAKTSLKSQGIAVNQTITYEVVELRDDAVVLDMRLSQGAEPQLMESPGLPEGATMKLESLKSSGSGRIELAMNGILPKRVNSRIVSDLMITTTIAGKVERRTQRVTLEVTLSPVELPAEPAPEPTK